MHAVLVLVVHVCLNKFTNDYAENYNRTPVYPEISEQYKAKMHEIMDSFKENRRGIIE